MKKNPNQMKEKVAGLMTAARVTFYYGFIPTVLILGFMKGSDEGAQPLTIMRYLFCCCGSVIKVYNTINGECLHDLKGHAAVVTGVAVNPSNVLQIFSCCKSGQLLSWDYLDGAKLKTHDLHMSLYGIISVDSKTDSIMMIAQTSQHKVNKYALLQWSRDKDNPSEYLKPKVLIPDCSRNQNLVSFGCMNQFAASAQKTKLTVYFMKKETTRVLTFNKHKDITCVACHPTEYCIATGIKDGRIVFWYSFFDGKEPQSSMVHWHSLAVLCLDFTPDGSILLSGGHECVFVRWQMNNHHQKDFKPRMGAPLKRVLSSPDGNFFATVHADNVIQVMDINMSILHVHRGMSRANWNIGTDQNPIPAGLIYDPRSRAIITNGLPGHLQFYSLSSQKQLYNLDIVGQNYISPENLNHPPVVTKIQKAAISQDGHWLASFEMWDDGFFTPELRLKIWEYSSSEQTYVLNTVVETPHETEVSSMCFRPSPPASSNLNPSPTLVTTGKDRCFKLWTLIDDTDIYRANTRWDCDSIGFYKDMETVCADFSCDGSSLAVAFEHLLTIWDPEKNVVRTTLSNDSQDKRTISAVKFGSGDSRYFLLSMSGSQLKSWNLLSLTVEWNMDMNSLLLFKDPVSDLMATVSTNGTLTMFKPMSPEIIFQQEKVSSFPVLDALFIPNNRPEDIIDVGWPGSSQIYMYASDHSLLTLDREDRIQQQDKIQIHQSLPKSGLSAIMAEKVVRDKGSMEVKETQGRVIIADDDFVSTMLHTNEPISAFCDQFLDKLLIKKKHKSRSRKEKEEEDEDTPPNVDLKENDSGETSLSTDILDTALADFLKEESEISKRNDAELDRLLSKPSNWVDWCATLSLK